MNNRIQIYCNYLKGHGNEADFLGFLQKLVPHESLTLPFGPFRFWLRIRGDIRIRKTTPRYHWYRESPTPRIVESGSRRLPASLIRGVGNSPHHPYGESATEFFKKKTLCIDGTESESSTPRTSDTVSRRLPVASESRRLRVPLSRGVDDSAYRWYGESLFEKKN